MAKLIYSAISSLDGYVADEQGNFDWSKPDDEVHSFVNDLERDVGTHLLGRRMYEVLAVWETMNTAGQAPHIVDFAEIWRATDKVVYSRTLDAPTTGRTRLEREFDPRTVAEMKEAADRDLAVGGPNLATSAIEAGIVDELHLFVSPIVVGGGKQSLPDGVRMQLELRDERRFGNGVVYLAYGVRR